MSISIATASYDRKICFWDAGTGRCLRQISYPDSQINCMAMSPDRSRLAVGGFSSLRIYDVVHPINANQNQSPGASAVEGGHTQGVTSLHYLRMSGNSYLLLSTSEDGHIKLWDPRASVLRLRKDIDAKAPINCAAVHPQQNLLFTGSQLGYMEVWNLQAIVASCIGGGSGASEATVSGDASAPLHDVVVGDGSAIRSIAINPMGNLITVANNQGRVYCYNSIESTDGNAPVIGLPSVTPPESDPNTTTSSFCAQPDGAPQPENSSGPDGAMSLNSEALAAGAAVAAPGEGSVAAADANDASETPSGSGSPLSSKLGGRTTVQVIQLCHAFRAHHKYILRVAISPNGKLLATTSADYTTSLWSVPEMYLPSGSTPQAGPSAGAPASPMRSTSNLSELHTSVRTPTAGSQPQFPSPDKSTPNFNASTTASPPRLDAGASLGPSMVCPTNLFPLWKSLTGHNRWVWDCAFSACSHYLVTVSSDHAGRLWDLAANKVIATYSGHTKPVTCVILDDQPPQSNSNNASMVGSAK